MLQKTRKVGEPTTPEPFFGGGGSAARQAALAGRAALSKIDKVAAEAKQQQELERERSLRAFKARSCSC